MNFVRTQVLLLILSWTTSLSMAQTANNAAAQAALTQASALIAGLVQANSRLTPEFLRLGFHDCIGGCDGCVDLSNPDNNGLGHPISVLDPVVRQFATPATGLSRADIWALACMVGADVADHGIITQPISFTQNWFGRVDCENTNSVCRNAQGQTVPCSATAGPHRLIPSPTFNSPAVFSFFATNFGFNERQTVTIMGAHTVGRLVKNESGIDGPNGWTIDNVKLQHEYYVALVTSATAATPDSQKVDLSPDWVRKFEDNTGTGFPNLNRWQLQVLGLNLVMLNSDVALVRDLTASNSDTTTGAVSCHFNSNTGTPACPMRSTINVAIEFSDNNDLWLREFKATLDLMLTNGYNRIQCSSAVCPLGNNRVSPTSPPVVAVQPTVPVPPTRPPTLQPTLATPPAPRPFPLPTPRPSTPPTPRPSTPPTRRPSAKPTTRPSPLPTPRPSPRPTPLPPTQPKTCVGFLGLCGPTASCCGGLKCFGLLWKQCWL